MDTCPIALSGCSPVIATANGIRHDGSARYDGLTTNGHDVAIAWNGPKRHVATATNNAVVVDAYAAIDDDVATTDANASHAKPTVANDELGLQSTNADAATSV